MKTTSTFHASTVTTDVAAVGQNFSSTKFHEHTLSDAPDETIDTQGRFFDRIETIIVRVKGLASSTLR